MAGTVKEISKDEDFDVELTNAGTKLVIVDFFATWCGPCVRIAPKLSEFALKYPEAVFLKVDVDKCEATGSANGVTAMPTFIFFRSKSKIDMLRGADHNALEEKIKNWYGDGATTEESQVKGHMDLNSFINKSGCECLNEDDEHTLEHALTSKGGYLCSDCDEQLIISIAFNQKMKLHSMKLTAPQDKGPKKIKLFINLPYTLDFDKAESMSGVEEFVLSPDDLQTGVVPLTFVRFQNIDSITVFVADNQEGGEQTQIDYISFIGSPTSTTNMGDFKRVAGKAGEAH